MLFKIRNQVKLLGLCILLSFSANAQVQYTKDYVLPQPKPISTGRLAAQSIIDAGNGNSLAIYNTIDANGKAIYITEVDPNGTHICTSPISQFQNGIDVFANSITDAGHDRFVIVGRWGTATNFGLFIVRVNSTGAIISSEVLFLPSSSNFTDIEGINVIKANGSFDEYIVTARVKDDGHDKLMVVRFHSSDPGSYALWNVLFSYAPPNPGETSSDVLPTSIVAVEGGYVIVGRHILHDEIEFPGSGDHYSVFAIKINEIGLLQGNFNTYHINTEYADENAFKPGIQHLPATGNNVLVFGTSLPNPFPQTTVPPSASATSIAASIGLNSSFNTLWGYVYWLPNEGIEMGFHSIYHNPNANYNKSNVLGYMLRDNGMYTPIFAAIDADDGRLARYLTRYWLDRDIFSPFAMNDNSATNRFQYIGSEGRGETPGKLDLIRVHQFGYGLCDEDKAYAYKNVPANRVVYNYVQSSLETFEMNPLLDLQVCYIVNEGDCTGGGTGGDGPDDGVVHEDFIETE
ncbi:MAG: hypothetical protein R2800_07665 [Flavipsychrobacter sp.]